MEKDLLLSWNWSKTDLVCPFFSNFWVSWTIWNRPGFGKAPMICTFLQGLSMCVYVFEREREREREREMAITKFVYVCTGQIDSSDVSNDSARCVRWWSFRARSIKNDGFLRCKLHKHFKYILFANLEHRLKRPAQNRTFRKILPTLVRHIVR